MGTKLEGVTVLATIEIDLGSLAEEWEPVRVGRPRKGEQFVSGHMVLTSERDWAMDIAVIVRRKWTFPSWLKARWYAETASYRMVSNDFVKPTATETSWRGAWYVLYEQYIDIPRIGGDWRQSLRENPNWKAS